MISLSLFERQLESNGTRKGKTAGSKKPWSKEEDEAMKQLVEKHGVKKWSLIANILDDMHGFKGRNGKQCRERWHNHLNPTIKRLPLSDKEKRRIFAKHRKYGNKWAKIAGCLNGRTDNVVKNFYHTTLRRQLKRILKKVKGESSMPKEITLQYINGIMAEHGLSYDEIDDKIVRAELELLNRKSETRVTGKKMSHLFLHSEPEEAKVAKIINSEAQPNFVLLSIIIDAPTKA